MRCLLPVLAAARVLLLLSTTTALAFLLLVTFRTGMIIFELATTTVSIFYITRAPHGRRHSPASMLRVGQGSTSTRKKEKSCSCSIRH